MKSATQARVLQTVFGIIVDDVGTILPKIRFSLINEFFVWEHLCAVDGIFENVAVWLGSHEWITDAVEVYTFKYSNC